MSEAQSRPTVITGCSGFVGANLAAGLLTRGARVIGVEGPSGVDWRTRSIPGLEVIKLDLCGEDDVRAFVRDVQPAAIFNCAAYGAYSIQNEARRIYDVNVLGVRNLLDAVREVPGFRAFIQAGSSSEYGFNCAAPDEDAVTLPDSDYAVSKIAATALVRLYAQKHGVPAWALRLYSLYGPYEDFSRLIPALLLQAREGRYPPLVNPQISRDFVFVDDVTRAFEAILERAPQLRPGDVFNIGTGTRTTLADLTSAVRELFHLEVEPVWGTMPNRSWDHSAWYADPRKAAAQLGWQATTSVRDGLAATMRWIEQNPALVAEGREKTVLAVRR
ncbi:MAG TPA: NAD-dependent epimerase/dehydratase family protein [Polyangia bacterium]|jgi:dolichol-phosphate mannosyltransferase|nr:NAD-dependent epimerase/dehydratase family protein [Polyangia bacterium]